MWGQNIGMLPLLNLKLFRNSKISTYHSMYSIGLGFSHNSYFFLVVVLKLWLYTAHTKKKKEKRSLLHHRLQNSSRPTTQYQRFESKCQATTNQIDIESKEEASFCHVLNSSSPKNCGFRNGIQDAHMRHAM